MKKASNVILISDRNPTTTFLDGHSTEAQASLASEETQLMIKVPSFLCRRDDRYIDYPIRNSPLCS